MTLMSIQPAAAQEPTSVWIVSGDGALDLLPHLARLGLEVHTYERLGMLGIVATPTFASALQHQGFDVYPNEEYELHLKDSVPYIGADTVAKRLGSMRSGPTVVVIDTGLETGHPGFTAANTAANVRAQRSQSGLVTGVAENIPIIDRSGHGSHVAGIVAGNGNGNSARDPNDGLHVGVYANGRVASFQAATDAPDPKDIAVDLAAALEGFEWALQNQKLYDIRVITNSWGSTGELVPDHPASKATLTAYASGITVFFSAGNDGEQGTLNKHCKSPWVLCVAGGSLDGTRSSFSSMGTPPGPNTAPYDHPDLTAPGSQIMSVRPLSQGTEPGELPEGTPESYVARSGTSMAAPHAAGVAAQLVAANGNLSPDEVMDILVGTTDAMSEEPWRVGAGYINAVAAYNLAVRTRGNLQDFLAGDAVKYGGPATGDNEFAADPISVGYDQSSGGDLDAALIGIETVPWITSSWVGGTMLGAGFIFVLVAIRWRRPHIVPESPAAPGPST
jgi:serine protease AprX